MLISFLLSKIFSFFLALFYLFLLRFFYLLRSCTYHRTFAFLDQRFDFCFQGLFFLKYFMGLRHFEVCFDLRNDFWDRILWPIFHNLIHHLGFVRHTVFKQSIQFSRLFYKGVNLVVYCTNRQLVKGYKVWVYGFPFLTLKCYERNYFPCSITN